MTDNFDVELQLSARAGQMQFDYAFTGVCFAALALSLQFSERTSAAHASILIVSWGCYLVAALSMGWRLMTAPQYAVWNWGSERIRKFVQQRTVDLKDPQFLNELATGRALSTEDAEPLTGEGVEATLKKEQENLNYINEKMSLLSKRAQWAFKVAIASFILALAFNGLYLSLNLLSGKDNSRNEIRLVENLDRMPAL